jgi:transposase
MRTVALDYGNRITLCEVHDGAVVERATVTEFAALTRWLGPQTGRARVAIEACREAWFVVSKLREWGHEPVMVDTTRVRQLGVGHHRRKTDRIDAELLARALEQGHIREAHVISEGRQALRLQLSVRRMLVEQRAHQVTSIRALARVHGHRVRKVHAAYFARALRDTPLDEATRALVEPLVLMVEGLDVQIAVCDGRVQALAAREPVIERLKTTPGVGTIVAAAFVSVVDDAGRFRHAHQLESYLGLVPSEYSSSGRRSLGHITKQGNAYLRTVLVQAAWTVLRQKQEDPLKEWGQALLRRRGARVAVVALARRLAGVLWAIWRDGTVYEPRRVGLPSKAGLERAAQSLQFQAARIAKASRKRIQSSRRERTAE